VPDFGCAWGARCWYFRLWWRADFGAWGCRATEFQIFDTATARCFTYPNKKMNILRRDSSG